MSRRDRKKGSRKDQETFIAPPAAARNAIKGLRTCPPCEGTDLGHAIAKGTPLKRRHMKRLAAYFKRNECSNGSYEWLLRGGDAGCAWVRSIQGLDEQDQNE